MARPKKNTNKQLLADKMRRAVLQAAIEGKLTEQHPTTDGYARDLLADIESENLRLIQAGEIKREKSPTFITEEEKPFDIPDNWEWVRLEELFDISRGGSPRPIKQFITESKEGLNWIKIGDTDIGGKYITSCNEKIIPEGREKSRFVKSGDLLLTNSMSYGRPYILKVDGCIHDGWLSLSPFIDDVSKEYFYYLLSSNLVKNQFDKVVSGAVVKNLNKDKVKDTLLPLPPILEQQRIVDMLEEVLAQIDILHADENALYTLQTAFPRQIQASLLQAAIEGKLTQQDATKDGNASDLLADIEREKQRLFKAGEINRQKTLPPIIEEEKPFDIPDNWEWVRLDQLSIYIQRGRSPKYSSIEEIPVISQKCVQWNGFSLELAKFIDPGTKEKYQQERFLQEGDLLWNSTGLGTVGRITKYQEERNKYDIAVADSHVTVVRLLKKYVLSEYVELFISSPVIQHNIEDICSGSTKQKELATSTVKNTVLPLPPLAEQLRIVELLEQALPEIQTLKEI